MNVAPLRVLLLGVVLWALAPLRAGELPAKATLIVDAVRLTELESTSSPRSPDTLLELALAYDERHEPARAVGFYQLAAAAGVGPAELRLGAMAETGEGVSQSYVEARVHYERAIALGVPEASLRLGMLYLEGWGVAQNTTVAVADVEQAANASYRPAQQVLSDMYFTGVKVGRDLKKALTWAERAAQDRDPRAQTNVGAIRQAAVTRPEDLRLAREWYQLSSEQDYTRGMLAMASTFLRRGANPEEIQLGLRWLDLAAEGGNAAAAFYRAGPYLWDRGTPGTPATEAKARALLTQAANAGESSAAEVLELEKSGRPLADAFRYVMTVPFEDRYVQRLAASRPPPGSTREILPLAIKVVRPVYPAALRLTKTEGEVTIEFIVDTTGRVRDAHLVSSTHPGFASRALESIKTWRFLPGVVDGRTVNTRMRVPIHFRMSDIHEPNAPTAGATGARQGANDYEPAVR